MACKQISYQLHWDSGPKKNKIKDDGASRYTSQGFNYNTRQSVVSQVNPGEIHVYATGTQRVRVSVFCSSFVYSAAESPQQHLLQLSILKAFAVPWNASNAH